MRDYSVTVLMSLFWKENPIYLNEALESLHLQTHQANEVLIVYEGNLSRELEDVLDFWKNKLGSNILKLVSSNGNNGLPACLNTGLSLAKSEWIARFDTDDVCLPERIERQVRFLKDNPDIVISSAPLLEYNETMTEFTGIRKVPLEDCDIKKSAKWQSPFNHPSTIYKKDVALNLGGYPLLSANEDYAFFCKFLTHGYKTRNYEKPLVKARTGGALISRRRGYKYLKGEIECIWYLKKIGFLKWHHYLIHLIVKSIVRSLPPRFVKLIYKQFRTAP